MSLLINHSQFVKLVENYLPARLSPQQISSLSTLSKEIFTKIITDIDSSIDLYNHYPECLPTDLSTDLFLNTNHLKTLLGVLPSYSSVLEALSLSNDNIDIAFGEMRDSTYFHHIYEITKPEHLLANLMTLVYRCHLLSSNPKLRKGDAQISSTLEEMSSLRFLLGEDNLHFQATRHWILDWQEEGFSQKLAEIITKR